MQWDVVRFVVCYLCVGRACDTACDAYNTPRQIISWSADGKTNQLHHCDSRKKTLTIAVPHGWTERRPQEKVDVWGGGGGINYFSDKYHPRIIQIGKQCLLGGLMRLGSTRAHSSKLRHDEASGAENTGNIRHWIDVVLMLGQRLRRWHNIKTTSIQCLIFSGKYRLAKNLPALWNWHEIDMGCADSSGVSFIES